MSLNNRKNSEFDLQNDAKKLVIIKAVIAVVCVISIAGVLLFGILNNNKYVLNKPKDANTDETSYHETKSENQNEEAEGEVSLNKIYGNVVSYNECIYYLKYNYDSFTKDDVAFAKYIKNQEAENQLVCRTADGTEAVLFTSNGFSDMAIANQRIYYQESNGAGYQIKSCNLNGGDIKNHCEGTLRGVINNGRYIICKSNNSDAVFSIDTEDNDKIINISDDPLLICSNDSVICTQSNNAEDLIDLEHTLYEINGDATEKKELYVNKAASLDSVNGYDSMGYVSFYLPYIENGNLYYTYENRAGSSHNTQSQKILKVSLDDGQALELSGNISLDLFTNELSYENVNDSMYTDYLNSYNTTSLNKSDYSQFSDSELGKFGTEGSGVLKLEYCEKIGDKEYVLLSYADFTSWNGWKQCYKFKKCALFEKNISTGESVLIYTAEGNEDENKNSIYTAYLSVLDELSYSYNQQEINMAYYSIFDMNNDGVKELITSSGTCEADLTYEFYSFNGDLISLGTAHAGHSSLYVNDDDEGLLLYYCPPPGDMCIVSLYGLTISKGKLKQETIYENVEITLEERDKFHSDHTYIKLTDTYDLSQLDEL
ncbi:MAG: hypothetical protein ACI4RR_04015, partial [Eubacterium sp.]